MAIMIKICGITRREDAEAAVEAGASAIGFVFYPESPRYVAPQHAAELGAGLPILKVGVFVNETAASVERVMRAANLDIAQIYDGEAPSNARVWRAIRMTGEDRSISVAAQIGFRADFVATPGIAELSKVEAILLDGPTNGISFDWTQAAGVAPKIILAGGLDASNVAEAIRIARPWGVDASSKLETAPGIKDRNKMREFVRAAQEAVFA